MGVEPEAKLVVKHTFLEYVGDDKPTSDDAPSSSSTRQRAQTEPALESKPGIKSRNETYGKIPDQIQGSEPSSSSSHPGDSPSSGALPFEPSPLHKSALMLPTPESTPLHFPMARHMPEWLAAEGEWTEGLLPEAATFDQQAMDAYYQQWQLDQAMCGWWPEQYVGQASAADYSEFQQGMGCGQFQAGMSLLNMPYMQMAMDANVNAPSIKQEAARTRGHSGVSASTGANGKETRTTIMLRDLPEGYSRTLLLKLLDAQGFFGRFDFIYLPVDFKHQKNLGYALINLVSPAEALRLTSHFEGFVDWGVPSERVGSVGWCSPQQGLEAHVERYRNSPVMHESVPEEWRPLLLKMGVPIAFPPPTLKIKAPKVKGRQS